MLILVTHWLSVWTEKFKFWIEDAERIVCVGDHALSLVL